MVAAGGRFGRRGLTMRVEGGGGLPLQLVAAPADLRALDLAFSELLQNVPIDDWQIRTGASREEIGAVWTGVAGSRHVPLPGGDAVALPVSERALEILEAALFELVRDRSVPMTSLEASTGVSRADWLRLYVEVRGLVASLDLQSAPLAALSDVPREVAQVAEGMAVERFRNANTCLVDATVSGVALDLGDARKVRIERARLSDVACRNVRLIESTILDTDVTGNFSDCAVVDCAIGDVSVSGRLSGVRFVGGRYAGVDLRSAQLIQCRFCEFGPGEGIFLPDGNDCFVIPVAAVERAVESIRGRVGRGTLAALADWLSLREADYVSVARAFWSTEMLPRGAHNDDEVEYAVMNRLFMLRVSSIASLA